MRHAASSKSLSKWTKIDNQFQVQIQIRYCKTGTSGTSGGVGGF
jgi:hypothetical protein